MSEEQGFEVYDLSINVRVSWQAHSLSTEGSKGSNRVMPRRQLLANRSETDACSGNIVKHHHAVLLAEYLASVGVPLCAACQRRDSRRVAALVDQPEYRAISLENILRGCGLCDVHGFLVMPKNANLTQGTDARQRLTQHIANRFFVPTRRPKRMGRSR